MTEIDFDKRIQQLLPYLRIAGNQVIQMREEPGFSVMQKPDDSPVSNADIWANSYFIDILEQHFPGEPIVGEESESKEYPIGADRLWFVDPIDGTRQFVSGKDNFFILIGFCIDGVPAMGLCYKPTTGLLIAGNIETGVWSINKDGIKTPMQAAPWPDEPGSDPSIILKRPDQELKQSLLDEFGIVRHPYVGEQVDMLAPLFGMSNGYVTYRETAYWDLCAPAAIMHSAGYEIPHQPYDSIYRFNEGGYKAEFFYSLPLNTPAEVKKLLFSKVMSF